MSAEQFKCVPKYFANSITVHTVVITQIPSVIFIVNQFLINTAYTHIYTPAIISINLCSINRYVATAFYLLIANFYQNSHNFQNKHKNMLFDK